ncbi:hypothetical protein NIES21_21100 [Anabaenopsis circularis NIES-21]|uniref:Uncharacterized protein n=1 Tax=Anabaenopsis circularis NIES-21 TaxID=1085406 RepID=A0A1Z4GFK5_9CYAN|nr:hypothetical protein NIES21_21100 [Anabaenopsis circularis NIES-21]
MAARRWENSGVVMRSPGIRWWYSRCRCFSWLDFKPWRFPKIVSIGVYDQLTGPPNPSIVYFTTVVRVQALSFGGCDMQSAFRSYSARDSQLFAILLTTSYQIADTQVNAALIPTPLVVKCLSILVLEYEDSRDSLHLLDLFRLNL